MRRLCTDSGCAPSVARPLSGVLRTSRFFPEETVMFLFGEICLACGWEGLREPD
jgi:hypothetical protein